MTPDVNVLVAASRGEHVHHLVARDWLAAALRNAAGGSQLLLMPMVVASFCRLVSNARVFVEPTSGAAAVAFIDSLVAAPNVVVAKLGDEWPMFRESLVGTRFHPNDVPDLWLAAAVRSHGDHLVTFDTGFRRWLKRSELTILD